MKVVIPKNKTFEEITKLPINELSLQWLIDHSIHDKYDGSAKAFLTRACNLAMIYREDLREIFDKSRATKKNVEE